MLFWKEPDPLFLDPSLLPNTQDGVAMFCGAVIFNMALVLHKRSRQDKGVSLPKALQLYGSSIDMFSKVSSHFDLSGVISAALNNKATIYFAGDDFEGSRRELARLQLYLTPAEHSVITPSILDAYDFQGILLNLLLLKAPVVAEAA